MTILPNALFSMTAFNNCFIASVGVTAEILSCNNASLTGLLLLPHSNGPLLPQCLFCQQLPSLNPIPR